MKKLITLLLLAAILICGLVACGNKDDDNDDDGKKGYDYDAIPDSMESSDGKYEIAFVTDIGQLKDKSFNQGTWEGTKRYAKENNKSYKYYQPANGNTATDDDRFNAMKAAVDGGAKIVICAGYLQETALKQAAEQYPDVKFVFIDGYQINDSNGNNLTNVAPISFQEEQSGYLAGYAAVKEGYTKLGFSGGGGGTNPACCRFGYGYVQGAQAAAAALGITVEMKYTWAYGATFSASSDLQSLLNGWYSTGTEVVFSCGGQICQSAFSAAAANDAYVIGVDVDQSGDSDTVITSATKGLREAVMYALEKFYGDKFDDLGGKSTVLGISDDAVGLPTDGWKLEKFSVEDYNKLVEDMKNGTITVDSKYDGKVKDENFANVTLTIID